MRGSTARLQRCHPIAATRVCLDVFSPQPSGAPQPSLTPPRRGVRGLLRMRAATAIPRPPSSRLWRATPHGLAEQLGRLRVVVVVALLGAAALPEGGPSSLPAVALLTTVYVAAQLLARALLLRTRRLSSERRWLVPIALDIAVTTVVLPLTGGARSPLVLIYLLPAVMAGGVLGLRAALGVVTAEAAAYAVGTAVSSTPLTMAARSSLALVLTLYTVAILAALVHRARSEAQGLADEIAETVRAVGRGADLATSLSVVGTKVGALTGATMAVIHVRPAGGDVFEPHWSEGVLTGYLAALEAEGWSRVPSTPPASVHLDRDSSATGPWAAWLAQSSLGSVWLIPIVAEDQLVGRIDLGFVEAHPGLGDMLGLVQTLLYPAGLAVIRDARTQALRHRAEALARLQAGALRLTAGDTIAELLQAALELIRELTGAQDAAVAVWDEHDDLVELVTAGTEDAAAGPAAVEVLEAVAGSQELRRTAWPRGAARSPGSTGETVEPCLLAVPIPHLGDWRGAFSLMGKTGASAFTVEDEEMGQAIGAHVAAVLHLHRALRAERDTHDALLAMLVEISDAHEHAVEDHSQRVHAYARMIAEALGVPEAELAEIANGGLLHDIGKL
ncbi:MAG TPA: GAF domain-containing protein, partial [Candidatus Dormibacteraeota bacterium]|nr:GAF domain-containing protein [Candidatus Dormibacteraeota bacterium]